MGAFPLGPFGLNVGRHPDNHVAVTDTAVSLRHCRIFFEGGLYKVADLGSRSGTMVNGRPVRTETLHPNDVIEFGRHKLKFIEEGPVTVRRAGEAGVRRPSVTRIATDPARETVHDRMSRLAGTALLLAKKYPIRALLLMGLCLFFVVVGLSRRDPRILRRIVISFPQTGHWLDLWLRQESGLSLLERLEGKKDEEEAKPKTWVGLLETKSDKGPADKKKLVKKEGPSKPRLKLIEGIVSDKGYRGNYGAQTSAILLKPGKGVGGTTYCLKGRRSDTPCLAYARMEDGSERILIKWIPGSFHKDSWQKLPDDVITALRDTAPYPEGYIDPEEELLPKPPPTVLSLEEAEAMFHAITGLDPQGDVLAGKNPWDQLLKVERYAKAAMNCPTCPMAARVQSDRGVYYGEKVK
ncbi:MAG: FHA domain-containing protein [Elusimicrobiota bacterium]